MSEPPLSTDPRWKGLVVFGTGSKFDIQLSQALIYERRLAHALAFEEIDTQIELKSESHLWERTGNICIEYERNGKPTGISVTTARWWAHQLRRDGEHLATIMVPMPRLKWLCADAKVRGRYRTGVGDDGLSSVYLLRLSDLWK